MTNETRLPTTPDQRNKVTGTLLPTGATTSRNPARREAQGRRCKQYTLPEAGKVLGGLCSKLDTTFRNHNGFGAQGRRGKHAALLKAGQGVRCPLLNAGQGARCPLPTRDKVPGALCPTLDTTSRNHNGFGAQGRRGREADPDSRSEAEGLGRAEGPMRGPGEGGVIWWSTAK